jgi:CCR4-NOT transcription complex subunit 1
MVAPWPQFCSALLANPQLRESDPELYARVEAAQVRTQGNQAPTMSLHATHVPYGHTPAVLVMQASGAGGAPPPALPGAAVSNGDGLPRPPGMGPPAAAAAATAAPGPGPSSGRAGEGAGAPGSSRFLNLQPAEGPGAAPSGNGTADAEVPAPASGATPIRGGLGGGGPAKEAPGPSGRGAATARGEVLAGVGKVSASLLILG